MTATMVVSEEAERSFVELLPGYAFAAIMIIWLAMPFALRGVVAQDGVPMVVAGSLVTDDPAAVYDASPQVNAVSGGFIERTCELFPREDAYCRRGAVSYISPPLALPLVAGLAALPAQAGIDVLRLLGAGALVGGAVVMWRLLAGQSTSMPWVLVVTAALLTPVAEATIALGQTSPWMFLSAMVGISLRRTVAAGAAGVLLAATAAFKAFPVALVAVLVLRRRWRMLAATVAGLVVLVGLSVVVAPASMYGVFLDVIAVIRDVRSDDVGVGLEPAIGVAGSGVTNLVRLVGAAAIGWAVWRIRDLNTCWAVAWLGLVLLVPQVWPHYLWVAVAAVAVALSERTRSVRVALVLPAVAAGVFVVGFLAPISARYVGVPVMIMALVSAIILARTDVAEVG